MGISLIMNNVFFPETAYVPPGTVPVLTTDINLSAPKDHSIIHPRVGHKHLQKFGETRAVDHTIFRHLEDVSETQPPLVTWRRFPEGELTHRLSTYCRCLPVQVGVVQ